MTNLLEKIVALLFLIVSLQPRSLSNVQAQVSCDVCAEAGPCFGSGPCASCGASVDCTDACAGCANAGPCRPCFEVEEENPGVVWPWPVQVPELPCDYAVDKSEVTLVEGEIPSWLEGSFYHAQHTNSSHQNYEGNMANPSGILSLTFNAGTAMASFALNHGQGWQGVCTDGPSPPFVMDCVVTINQFGTPESIASVCAGGNLAQFATDESGGVEFEATLEFTWKNATSEDTFPYGRECEGFCPSNLQPEHMPIDSNGDVYSLYFTQDPAGYRIFKIPKGTTERVDVSWVKSVKDVPSYLHMGPVPTASFIIVVEAPIPLNLDYDWAEYHASFDRNTPVTIYVMNKDDGEIVSQYTIEESFWAWHVVNAWEDCETGDVMLDITLDPTANTFKTFYNNTPGDFDESTLARITLPDPATAGLSAVATVKTLDTAGLSVEFPVTQNQYQFAGKTGHYWMAGSRGSSKAFPLSMTAIVKHDVATGKASSVWEPDGDLFAGEPFFIPRSKDQGPMSDDGAIVVVTMNSAGQLFGAVLDASNLESLALFEIPMAPAPSFGLHSFHSSVSTWESTPESCGSLPSVNAGGSSDSNDGSSGAILATHFSLVSTSSLILLGLSMLYL